MRPLRSPRAAAPPIACRAHARTRAALAATLAALAAAALAALLLATLVTAPAVAAPVPAAGVPLPAPPAAAAVHLRAPAPPARAIRAGEVVVTELPALPPGADEVELYLVPESGAPRIRVSPERDAAAGRIVWRMPALPSRRARLVLRAGGANAEWESAASAAFDAAPPADDELARALAGRSEAGFVLPAPVAPAAAALAGGGAAALLPDAAAPRAAEDAPAPPLTAAPPAARHAAPRPRVAATAAPPGPPLPATPAQVPLRY